MFVGKLTVLMSSSGVLLCLFMLSKIVMMGRLMVMMRGGVMLSGRLVVVLAGWMLLRHFRCSLRKIVSGPIPERNVSRLRVRIKASRKHLRDI
jgi:hypothetical protein